ncbi:MAG TPA: GNAT family N-acetyltransferase [Dehalococcoidia bacterium]|nr:GNAT family N-acetyltransferase [Dehalococcoidia bacterium]
MQIRPATIADEDTVLDLIRELFEPPGARPDDFSEERGREGIRWLLDSPGGTIIVAEEGGRIVGLATVYRTFPSIRHGWRCWLQDLVVTSSHRGQGAGKALLDAATQWARENGCTHLMLDSSNARKDAHRFYLREGMTQGSLTFTRVIR